MMSEYDEPPWQRGGKPRHPAREALRVMMGGKEPPSYVRGYYLCNLTPSQYEELASWVLDECPLGWSTGLGVLEACDELVWEAANNSNIPQHNSRWLTEGRPLDEYEGVQPDDE